jgi:hypothetical protein
MTKQQHYYVQNQKQKQTIEKAKTNVTSKDRKTMQSIEMNSTTNSKPFCIMGSTVANAMRSTFNKSDGKDFSFLAESQGPSDDRI